jgi:hypothetical protein
VKQYKPPATRIIVDDVIGDIDIGRQAAFTGGREYQPGDREVRKYLRGVLK